MEMIGAETYIEQFRNKNIEELLKEKNNLLKKIDKLEKLSRHPEDSIFPFYDLDTQLSQTREYLQKIEELIKIRGELNNDWTRILWFFKIKIKWWDKKIKYELYVELKELKKTYLNFKIRTFSKKKIVNPFCYEKYNDKKAKYELVKKYIKRNKL